MIHKFSLNGYNIVLDVNTRMVHVLDDLSYGLVDYCSENMPKELPEEAIVKYKDRYKKRDLEEAWSELRELFEQGLLYSKDEYAQYRSVGDLAPIKSMCLNVAHDCNLRCSYCFASTGDFGGKRELMPLEVGKAAIDFILNHSAARHNLEVDFFGGEPLMNFDVVKKIVEYARVEEKKKNKNIRFTITTNATLLDDKKIDFINREMSNVVLSIDGRKQVNDRFRKRADGSGSYDEILPKIKKLVSKRGTKEYYVRGTYTKENLDFMNDILHFADEGLKQISIEPVILNSSIPYAITETDIPAIFAEYEKLAKEMIRRSGTDDEFNFFHFMIDLDKGPCAIKLLRGCGCGNEYVAVTPEGDLYPCHQFVGKKDFIMGNVLNREQPIVKPEMKKMFSRANIFVKKGCYDCWAKFFCGGGCNANNSEYNGDILKPLSISCELEKKRVECALMIKAALQAKARQ